MKKNLLLIILNLLFVTAIAQDWSALGDGTNDHIRAMIEYNGDLIVGGSFTEAGGVPCYGVARWDGTQWHPMGEGFAGEVYDFEIYGDWLYASGWFFNDPDYTHEFEGIARWTGQAWSQLPDYDPNSWGAEIYDMMVYNNELYITNHSAIGFNFITRVSKYNGVTWTDLPGGFTHNGNQGQIHSLEIYNDQVVAGGWFDYIDDNEAKSVAVFDGNDWKSMNIPTNGLNDKVYKLLENNGDLYAGGSFFDPMYTTLAKLSGDDWTLYKMDEGNTTWDIQDLYIYQDNLYVSGVFYYIDGDETIAACSILRESADGYKWLPLNFFNNNSTQWIGYAMTEYDGSLHLGGDFQFAGQNNDPKNNIAKFDGVVPSLVYEDLSLFHELDIFLNPAGSTINFKVDGNYNGEYKVVIQDIGGNQVYNHVVHGNTIDITSFTPGAYNIMIASNGSYYSGKFIKTGSTE